MENMEWWGCEARLPQTQPPPNVRAPWLEVSFVATRMAMCWHSGSDGLEAEAVASVQNVLELD